MTLICIERALDRLDIVSGIALLVLMCACGQSGEQPPTPTAAQVTNAPTIVANPSSTTDPEITELRATGETLPPGWYTRAAFEPPIRLELDGSWQAVQIANGFIDIQQAVGSPDVIAVQFANVTGVVGNLDVIEAKTAVDAVDILQGNPNVTVIETSPSRIGGLEGSQVTIENQDDQHARVLEVPPGPLGIDPGRRLWIAFFDTEPGLLAVMVGGSTRQWDLALAEAEPVLESVVIGP
jgi:hypothetical protein